jgi:glucose-6-phosphate 1-dehydrogenase
VDKRGSLTYNHTMLKNNPVTFVLFGATGDLAEKKIMPSLLRLFQKQKLPADSHIVAFSRRPWSDMDYHDFIMPSLEHITDKETIKKFLNSVAYTQGVFDTEKSYKNLQNKLLEIDSKINKKSEKIFHLAIQPEFYAQAAQGLAKADLLQDPAKLLIEKPFGRDLRSAQELQKTLTSFIQEEQIYRIDHYLGKAGVWNILDERINNKELESRLNNNFAKEISVKLFEKKGIEGRGEFYDTVGVVRDVVENHVLEMLALTTMEIKNNMADTEIQKARAHVFENVVSISKAGIGNKVVRAQYEGYREERDVPKNSQTETYIKIITGIQNERWGGVPIILEAGKAMKEKVTEVKIVFKDNSEKIFNIDDPRFDGEDAYEVIIENALAENKKDFVSIDEVIASWKFITPIVENSEKIELKKYKTGSEKIV